MKSPVFLFVCSLFGFVNLVGQSETTPVVAATYTNEIDKLLQEGKVQEAFQWIVNNDQTTVKEHIFLNEIPAPPFKEMERAQVFMKMLQDIGVDSAWIDEVGNVLALRKGTVGGRTVALDAHLDTVFPEGTDVTVAVSHDTLFAPGIGDDTRGLAMVLAVLKSMNAYHIETAADILFVGTVGEEGLGDLRGVKHLFRDGGPRMILDIY